MSTLPVMIQEFKCILRHRNKRLKPLYLSVTIIRFKKASFVYQGFDVIKKENIIKCFSLQKGC